MLTHAGSTSKIATREMSVGPESSLSDQKGPVSNKNRPWNSSRVTHVLVPNGQYFLFLLRHTRPITSWWVWKWSGPLPEVGLEGPGLELALLPNDHRQSRWAAMHEEACGAGRSLSWSLHPTAQGRVKDIHGTGQPSSTQATPCVPLTSQG